MADLSRVDIQIHPKRKVLSVCIYDKDGLLIKSGSEFDIDHMYDGDEAIVYGLFKAPVNIISAVRKIK